jgi:phage terminase Nu1 subunit (DNA packaging protein)
MSQFNPELFTEFAAKLAAECDMAVEGELTDEVSDDALGCALIALVRLHAAKAQQGHLPHAFGRSNAVSVTDVAIVCTAMMEAADLSLFDLGAWQSMAGVGRRLASATPYRGNVNDGPAGRNFA